MVVKKTIGKTKASAPPTMVRVNRIAAPRPTATPTMRENVATVKPKMMKRPRGMPVRARLVPRKACLGVSE